LPRLSARWQGFLKRDRHSCLSISFLILFSYIRYTTYDILLQNLQHFYKSRE
jgi:hypothetical protein